MIERKSIHRLSLTAVMILLVPLSLGCQASGAPPVTEAPATATDRVPKDTVVPPTPAATETVPVPPSATPVVPDQEAQPAPTETPIPPASESQLAAAAAVAVLAQRVGVPEPDIGVQSVEAVEWPDASLGCPQPGVSYAQFITPGYRVLLEVDGQAYEMHTDTRQTAVLCEQEGSEMVVPSDSGTIKPGLEPLIALAKKDLAERLSIAGTEIEVLEAIAVVWPNAALGCPQPGMRYKQVPMDGAVIRLQAGGEIYEYHSGAGREPFLCEQPTELQKDNPPQIDLLKLTPPPTD